MIARAQLLVGSSIEAVHTLHSEVGAVAAGARQRGDCLLRAHPAGVVFKFSQEASWCRWCCRHSTARGVALTTACETCGATWCSADCRHRGEAAHTLQCAAVAAIKAAAQALGRDATLQARWACDLIASTHADAATQPHAHPGGASVETAVQPAAAAVGGVEDHPEPLPRLTHVLDMVQVQELVGRKPSKACKARTTAARAVLQWAPDSRLCRAGGGDAGGGGGEGSAAAAAAAAAITFETLQTALGALPLNSFGFYRDGDNCGSGVYPAASVFNHSCSPNVGYRHEGRMLVFYALTELRKGEPLFISYVDLSTPFVERADVLTEQWGFKCGCVRCVTERVDIDVVAAEDPAAAAAVADKLRWIAEYDAANVCECGTVLVPSACQPEEGGAPVTDCQCDSQTLVT
jgi:hypothetical protein